MPYLPDTNTTTTGFAGVSGTGTAPVQAPAATVDNYTNEDFAVQVLQDGGWPVTQNNITSVLQWMASENNPATWTGTAGANNPLNNGLGSGGGDGTGSYPDLGTAAAYAAKGLQGGITGTGAADAALKASADPTVFEAAMIASQWASGHYGNGSKWHTGVVGLVTAAESAAAGASGGKAGVSIGDPGAVTPGLNIKVPGLSGLEAVEAGAVKVFDAVTSVSFWTRLGTGALGLALVIGGGLVFFSSTKTGQKAVSDVETAGAVAAVA